MPAGNPPRFPSALAFRALIERATRHPDNGRCCAALRAVAHVFSPSAARRMAAGAWRAANNSFNALAMASDMAI
jgi:hypothetical protein